MTDVKPQRSPNRPIAVADTSVCSDNLGDQIIMDAFWRELAAKIGVRGVLTVPTHSPLGYRGKRLLDEVDLALVAGTNLLPASPHVRQLWRVAPLRADRRKFVLVGCGFGGPPRRWTVPFLRAVLHSTALHSTRDQRTADFLTAKGFRAINTGCITTWSGGPAAPVSKSDHAVVVLNRSLSRPDVDQTILEGVRAIYRDVRFWAQAPRDAAYLAELDGLATPLDGGVNALRSAVGEGTDMVTTRLHAALLAMSLGARTTLFALDERTALTTDAVGVTTHAAPRSTEAAIEAITASPSGITPRRGEIQEWTAWLDATLALG